MPPKKSPAKKSDAPRQAKSKPVNIKSAHTPGPWAAMPAPAASGDPKSAPKGAHEIWTALPQGQLKCLAVVCPSDKASVDAALMASAPQLAHEIRAMTALLEKIMASPKILEAMIEGTQSTDLEATLLHRLGCLRRLVTVVGPALSQGTYEPTPAEARWHVPEHAYRAKESAEDIDE